LPEGSYQDNAITGLETLGIFRAFVECYNLEPSSSAVVASTLHENIQVCYVHVLQHVTLRVVHQSP